MDMRQIGCYSKEKADGSFIAKLIANVWHLRAIFTGLRHSLLIEIRERRRKSLELTDLLRQLEESWVIQTIRSL